MNDEEYNQFLDDEIKKETLVKEAKQAERKLRELNEKRKVEDE